MENFTKEKSFSPLLINPRSLSKTFEEPRYLLPLANINFDITDIRKTRIRKHVFVKTYY